MEMLVSAIGSQVACAVVRYFSYASTAAIFFSPFPFYIDARICEILNASHRATFLDEHLYHFLQDEALLFCNPPNSPLSRRFHTCSGHAQPGCTQISRLKFRIQPLSTSERQLQARPFGSTPIAEHLTNHPLSLSAPPPVPFPFEIPHTNMIIVFNSFDALLLSGDVFSTFIDAILYSIDGMSNDPHRPSLPETQLRWHQGAAELSVVPMYLISYQTLANLLAGLQTTLVAFGSITRGMYATRFDIYILNRRIGSGKLVSRPPNPSSNPLSTSTSDNSTATTARRRALTFPPDPFMYRVPSTPVSLTLTRYGIRLSLPDVLYLLIDVMFAAAGTIRDSGQDVLIGHSWRWKQSPIELDLYPKVNMSWRNLATAAKGMKDFMIAYGAMTFRFDVEMDLAGHMGIGSLGCYSERG